ncbi:MAG: SMP-30/gluconolactonase/LRE family protein [Acidimicrobiales bacterium]|nr:SMP-30/gluconolactonase/LRE family protein [Acidimicrobiales bacterium]
MSDMRIMAEGLAFPEGPIAMPDGSVILVEIAAGRLTRVKPDGSTEVVAETGGGPNGAAFGPDGRIYVCNNGGFDTVERNGQIRIAETLNSYVGGSIQAVDVATGKVETLYTEVDGVPLKGPNDLVFDRTGGFWFTDHGKTWERSQDRGGLYYAKADGSSVTEVVFPLEGPNGVGLSPDEDYVYAAETHTGRVRKWKIAEPGVLDTPYGKKTRGDLVVGLPGEQLLDSLAVDGAGHVCVATIRNGGISDIDPADGSVVHVPTGDPLTTNICFGGPDMTTAYITCSLSGTLKVTTWARPGLKLNFNPY